MTSTGEETLTEQLAQAFFDSELLLVMLLDEELRFLRVNQGFARMTGSEPPEWYVGKRYFELFPDDEVERFYRARLESGGRYEGRSDRHERTHGAPHTVTFWNWTLERVTLPGGAFGLLVLLHDVTRERFARDRSASRERLLASIARAVSIMVATPSPEEALGAVLGELGAGSGCDVINALHFEDEQARPRRLYRWAAPTFFGPAADLSAADGLVMNAWHAIARTGRSSVVHVEDPTATDEEKQLVASWKLRSLLIAPIRKEGFVWGTLTFGSAAGRSWEPIEVGAVETATAAIGAVLVRHEMEERLLASERRQRELAARITDVKEQEHRRIGRNLHDGLGQRLGVIRLALGGVAARMPAAARQELDSIGNMVADAMGETRRLAHNLHPAVIDDLGLGTALTALCEELTEVGGIAASARVDVPGKCVPARLRTPIYRITQEALQNVVRHARARSVEVALVEHGREITLTVRDDGIGIGATQGRKGLGLASMAERAELSEGLCEVLPAEGGGTLVRARWPLSAGT